MYYIYYFEIIGCHTEMKKSLLHITSHFHLTMFVAVAVCQIWTFQSRLSWFHFLF